MSLKYNTKNVKMTDELKSKVNRLKLLLLKITNVWRIISISIV